MGEASSTIRARWCNSAVSLLLTGLLAAAPASAGPGDCSQPVSAGANPTASDCLFILRAAVGAATCAPDCICAPKGTLPVSATDALLCLKAATGQGASLACPCGDNTTTSTTDATTTTSTTTTTSLPDAAVLVLHYDEACLQYTFVAPFHGGIHRIAQRGVVEFELDFAALDDRDDDGLEEVPVEVTIVDFVSEHPALGTIEVSLGPQSHDTVDRRSYGMLIERRNNFPGLFDLPPNVFAGDANLALHPWIVFTVAPTVVNVLHHDEPVELAGIVSGAPIAADDAVASADEAAAIPLLLSDDSSWFGAAVEDLRLTPLAATCGRAASIR